LPQDLARATSDQQRAQIFETFFDTIDNLRRANTDITNQPSTSPLKGLKTRNSPMKSPVKTSPLKSPAKRSRKINDENFSPIKSQESFSSPSKKGESSPDKQSQLSDRKSQRRKRITVDTEDQSTSPTKSTTSPNKLNLPSST
jgi:hypothetical protein